MTAEVYKQIKAEIKGIICGALETVARELCPHGFKISNRDLKRFLDIIKIESIGRQDGCPLTERMYFEDNGSSREHQFPGHQSRRGSKESHVQGGGDLNTSLSPPQYPWLGSRGQVHANFDFTKQHSYHEQPVPVPPNIRMEQSCGSLIHSHRVYVTAQADFRIRVYPLKPVKIGAAAGGGAGAVGGATGGAVAGAVIGSIVPGFGTVIGGIIGGVAGFVAGGAAGAGGGAGIGRAVVDNKYVTVLAMEVFGKLKDFSHDKNHNTCYCAVTGNTTCPYQGYQLRGNQ